MVLDRKFGIFREHGMAFGGLTTHFRCIAFPLNVVAVMCNIRFPLLAMHLRYLQGIVLRVKELFLI